MKADETTANYAELSDYLILSGGGSPFQSLKVGDPPFRDSHDLGPEQKLGK